jgi:hypothetical protein
LLRVIDWIEWLFGETWGFRIEPVDWQFMPAERRRGRRIEDDCQGESIVMGRPRGQIRSKRGKPTAGLAGDWEIPAAPGWTKLITF